MDNGTCPACRGETGSQIGEKGGYSLTQCATCRTVYVDPMPPDDVLSAFYSRYAVTGKYLRKKDSKIRRAARRLRFLPIKNGARFLDVGCNAGFTVAAALHRGLDAYGIDIDREAIKLAGSWLPAERFTACSVEEYAAQRHRADAVYMSEVIEHMPRPESAADALAKIIRPGGLLFITCPDAGHIFRPRIFTDWPECKPPEHLVWYTAKGLRTLFQRHGFERIRFRPHTKPSHRMTARRAAEG